MLRKAESMTINRLLSISILSISILASTGCSSITDQRGRDVNSQWLYQGAYQWRGVNDAPDYGARLPNNVGDYDRFCRERPWKCR